MFNIVILGRPNVGKSSIFNYLISKKEAVVKDFEGTTKDWRNKRIGNLVLWDTPGDFVANVPPIEPDLIYFVVENNILNSDINLYKELLKKYKNILVIINKIDKGTEDYSCFKDYIEISIRNRINLSLLKDHFLTNYEQIDEKEKKIWAIIGKPNVGKSSLVNLLYGKDINKVANENGTTKEYLPIEIDENILLDTPGQRNMVLFPQYSNIFGIIVMLDGVVERQDLRLINLAVERKKPLIVLINKVDMLKKNIIEDSQERISKIWSVNILKTSCLNKAGVKELKKTILNMEKMFYERIKTSKLNAWLKEEIHHIIPGLKFMSQIEVSPPVFYCDFKMENHLQKMLKKRLSAKFDFKGIDIKLKFESKLEKPTKKRI